MNQRSVFGFGRSAKPAKNPTWAPSTPRFDVATKIEIGARPYQQDALVSNFPDGDDIGIAVLADGMGGHLGGDLASAIVLGAAFATLKTSLIRYRQIGGKIPRILRTAVENANDEIDKTVAEQPEVRGMGSTLVACVTVGNQLYWASVGDSPLYLYRNGELKQLNADHSMGSRIDAMVASGLMTEEVGALHPQRNQLTSALCGDDIEIVDCPDEPFALAKNDIVILASDGLQSLSDRAIADLLSRKKRRLATEVAHTLMDALASHADAEQDNVSVMVLQVLSDAPAEITHSDKVNGTASDRADVDPAGLEKASDLLNEALRL